MIRAAIVSTVDADNGFIRVTLPDQDDAVSGDLPVVTPAGWAVYNGLPQVGERVVCVFPTGKLREGFCVGAYWTAGKQPPGSDDQRGVWFEDGSFAYYDRTSGTLQIKAVSNVHIEGNLIVTGSLTRGGEEI